MALGRPGEGRLDPDPRGGRGRGAVPDDELGVDDDLGLGAVRGVDAEGVQEDLGGLTTLRGDVLAHGREPEDVAQRVVVDADDRQVLRDAQPLGAGGGHDADRHLVGGGRDGRGALG